MAWPNSKIDRRCFLIGSAASGLAFTTAARAAARVSIDVRDLTPKFLQFYRAASAGGVTPDERFGLWKRLYGFAAVPPTPQGDAIARKLLDAAWARYPTVLGRIERGAAGVEPSPKATLERVCDLLRVTQPVHIKLIVYVGALEGNAFTVGENGMATVAIPVEQSPEDRGPVMAHEFVHAVQISIGASSGGWERTIGETVLSEGLAMRVAQALYPDRPARTFVETPDEPGWVKRAQARRVQILRDVRAAVNSARSQDVLEFTMGTGPSGLDREAYFAGWEVVDFWRRNGRSFADIVRIPEREAPAQVAAALDRLLA